MIFTIPSLVGNVAVLIAMSNIIVLSVSHHELGVQTGMNQTFRNLGSAVGPVLAATITASYTTLVLVTKPPIPPIYAAVPAATGFVILFALTATIALAGLLLSIGLRNYRFGADGTRHVGPRPAEGAPAAKSPAPAVQAAK